MWGLVWYSDISVHVFWIKNSIELSDNQFKSDVKAALIKVSDNISDRELNDFYNLYSSLSKNRENITESELKTYFYQQIDTTKQETFEYSQTILEENYKFPVEFFESDSSDSVEFKKLYSKEEITIVKKEISDGDIEPLAPTENFIKQKELINDEKRILTNQSQIMNSRLPILIRISNQEITLNLRRELEQRGVTTPFKYGVAACWLQKK